MSARKLGRLLGATLALVALAALAGGITPAASTGDLRTDDIVWTVKPGSTALGSAVLSGAAITAHR